MTPQALISAAAFTASAVVLCAEITKAHRHPDKQNHTQLPRVSDTLWSGLFAVLAGIIAACLLVWPYTDSVLIAAISAYTLWFCGHASLRRRLIAPQLYEQQIEHEKLRGKKSWLSVQAKLLLWICISTLYALELSCNSFFPFVLPHAAALELLLILLILILIYQLFLGSGLALALGVITFTCIGMVQGFVLTFKGSVLSIGDLYAAGTAAAVSGGYNYQLEAPMLLGFSCAALGIFCCSLLYHEQSHTHLASRLLRHWSAAGLAALALAFMLLVPNYQNQLHIKVEYWWEWQLLDHKKYCFLPSFIAEAQDLPIKKPAGYSVEAAKKAESELIGRYEKIADKNPGLSAAQAQWKEQKPSIVVVMNETFTDLTLYDDFGGYLGPEWFKQGFSDVLRRGKLAVSVNGGGTCNTEFEFLTGQSMAFVGNGKYPYTLYDFTKVATLPRQLAKQGYRCVALHPNLASNWDRDRSYKGMGFEHFYDIDDFKDAKSFHNAVSDEACYDKILDILQSGEQPQFIFTVTMQNHSGYDQGGIPADKMMPYADFGNAKLDDNTNCLIKEYLACIGESDRALKDFVSQLRKLDHPVLLVFFGDHQPYFSNVINDALYTGEDTVTHEERLYQSDYLIWANYQVAGSSQAAQNHVASASDLAAQSLEQIGMPLTPHQKAQLGARDQLIGLNLFGYCDLKGTWHDLNEDTNNAAAKTLQELHYLSYRDFGSLV